MGAAKKTKTEAISLTGPSENKNENEWGSLTRLGPGLQKDTYAAGDATRQLHRAGRTPRVWIRARISIAVAACRQWILSPLRLFQASGWPWKMVGTNSQNNSRATEIVWDWRIMMMVLFDACQITNIRCHG
jgi:hypothetical protein